MFRRTVSALNQQRNGCRGQRFSAISRTLGLNAAAIAQTRKRTALIPITAEGPKPVFVNHEVHRRPFAPHRPPPEKRQPLIMRQSATQPRQSRLLIDDTIYCPWDEMTR